MPRIDLTRLALALTVSIATVDPAGAQPSTAPQASWAGWARCQINVTGPGYTDQQTHTWTITGGSPKVEGAFNVYPGTWSVVGGGSLQRTQGNQTLMAQWATNAPSMSAPIAVFVRASDKRMFIQARHAQLRAVGSIQGYQQLIIDGKAKTPGKIAAEAFEWAFPLVVVSRPNPNASLVANGSSTPVVKGSVGLMQPGGSQATAACTWDFSQGAAPPPPPVVEAQTIPTPVAPGVTSGATGGATEGSTPACLGPPQDLVASVSTSKAATGETPVSLKWSAPTGGVGTAYSIGVGTAPGSTNILNVKQTSPQTSFSMYIPYAGSYYMRVYAVNGCTGGVGAPSNEVLVVVP
jgi:hypothetical protein